MKLEEMKSCAAETQKFFIETLPDVPFEQADIVIEFVPKSQMAKRSRELCAKYVPDKIINDSQARQLENSIAANALIGREKSAVLSRIDYKLSKRDWRRIVFHELMHIYCAKMEIDDGAHFIDIYGCSTTPENPNMTRDEKAYDGILSSGYVVWSEFIAQYYALKHTETRVYTVAEQNGCVC